MLLHVLYEWRLERIYIICDSASLTWKICQIYLMDLIVLFVFIQFCFLTFELLASGRG